MRYRTGIILFLQFVTEARRSVTTMTDTDDLFLILSKLRNGEVRAFEIIYDRFSDRLYRYVFNRVKSKEVAEEILQEIFLSLWQKRSSIEVTLSLEAYLFGAAKFKMLTYMRSERVRKQYAENFAAFSNHQLKNSGEEILNLEDLQRGIENCISELPEKCRTAFRLSRIDHQPISQIAKKMDISHRTVENYLSLALKHLRTSLGEFLSLYILLSVM